jgi:hypothetical protein
MSLKTFNQNLDTTSVKNVLSFPKIYANLLLFCHFIFVMSENTLKAHSLSNVFVDHAATIKEVG